MPNGPTAEADLPGTRGVANASDNGRRQMEKMAIVQQRAPRRAGLLLELTVARLVLPLPLPVPGAIVLAPPILLFWVVQLR